MITDNIIFSFSCNDKILTLDESEYGITNYEGIESTDYELEKSININSIGEKKKRKKILSRPITVEFDYLGSDENKARKRQELIRFFTPFSTGALIVNYLGVERKIEYEVVNFIIVTINEQILKFAQNYPTSFKTASSDAPFFMNWCRLPIRSVLT